MDYFSIERLDIIKKYNSVDHMTHKLDELYLNVWKVYIQSIKVELLKKNHLTIQSAKIKSIQDKKNINNAAIHNLLNNALCDKLSLCLYNNNKIYLVTGTVDKKFKPKKQTAKFLNTQKKIIYDSLHIECDEKKLNKLNDINKCILLFHSIYSKEFNPTIVANKIEKLSNNIKKYSKQLHTRYNRIESINKSISSLEKKCIEAKCSIQSAVEKSKKKNKLDLKTIRYLSSEIGDIQKKYDCEIDHINKLYQNDFIKNNKQICSICLEEDCRFIKTSCGHYFHVECITMYLEKIIYTNSFINITCPMCRQNMS
jgi:hypothetical protein